MAAKVVEFEFITGLKRPMFRNVRLLGSWNASGKHSDVWTESPIQETTGVDGSPVFRGSVTLDANAGESFQWGVILDGPQGANLWGIAAEVPDLNSGQRHRTFQVSAGAAPQVERYFLTHCRRLGANKHVASAGATPAIRFAVWAPNAKAVDVVFGPANGYIADNGAGISAATPPVPLTRSAGGIWEGIAAGTFVTFLSAPYMYRITNAQGAVVFRSDIFSRSQAGKGRINPAAGGWPGTLETLDGNVSCSLVIDPDVVRRGFESTPAGVEPDLIPAGEFWANEFTPGLPLPTRIEDLVIYELHVGSLGFGKAGAGNLADALKFLDHLTSLGVNAVELMPMAEFGGDEGWGYGNSHHFCIESSAGGRDKYRFFVRECHRRGIAVLQDVVYNHYDPNAERSESHYDSTAPEQDIFYWYEGRPTDYRFPDGGYLDNGSTGRTPRFFEENVRQQFISGAVFLIEEMHVDGLRVDLTQAIHRDNVLHANGHSVGAANIFGQKFLREWSRTLHMIQPKAMLIAEDHTGWDAVLKLPDQGGLGFDAKWQVAFYHNLIGDSDMAGDTGHVLKRAGFGTDEPLSMDRFSGALFDSGHNQVVFHESHDEAGNAGGTARTMVVAVNGAALIGPTRAAAESRTRVCFGLSLLSAGTPMFFMGEEIGAQKKYTYDNFVPNREDILNERNGNGNNLFRFCQDLISLTRRLRSTRSHNIDILHQSNANRLIAFKRWSGNEEVIIVASLNNHAFTNGYVIRKDELAIPTAGWKEEFNSDAGIYGGQGIGNFGGTVRAGAGRLNVIVPATGFVVFVRQ